MMKKFLYLSVFAAIILVGCKSNTTEDATTTDVDTTTVAPADTATVAPTDTTAVAPEKEEKPVAKTTKKPAKKEEKPVVINGAKETTVDKSSKAEELKRLNEIKQNTETHEATNQSRGSKFINQKRASQN